MKRTPCSFAFFVGLAGSLLIGAAAHASAPTVAAFAPTRFTVTDSGTTGKPEVLLIPGLASSKAVWDAEANLLAPNYRLHIVQVDGFAGTPAGGNATGPLMSGIVEELHRYIETRDMHPIVIGHSLGGTVTLMLEDKYPHDVRKAVLLDALPYIGVLMLGPAATPESTKVLVEGIKAGIVAATPEEFAAMQPKLAASMVSNPDAQKLVIAASVASDRTVMANAMAEDLMTDLRGQVASIKVPTLLLYPYDASLQGADPAKVDAIYGGAYKSMPNVKLVRIDGSRHFIMYDQPARMDAAIEAFLQPAGK